MQKTYLRRLSINILQICHDYKQPFLDLANEYINGAKKEHDIYTIFLKGKYLRDIEKINKGKIYFLDLAKEDLSGLKINAIIKLKKLLENINVDFEFCISHRSKPTFISIFATSIKIISVHHHEGDYRKFRKRLIFYLFKKRILFAGVSNFIRKDLEYSFSSWEKHKFTTIYNSNSSLKKNNYLLSKIKSRHYLKLNRNDFIFANVGRLHEEKNQQLIIKSFSKFISENDFGKNKIKLILIGVGSELDNLKCLAKQLNCIENIIFYGYLQNAKSYFSAFDCFILSTKNEPFGMVLLEAIMANNIVISSDSGAPMEIIGNSNFLFNDSNETELTNRMINVYNNFKKFKKMSFQIKKDVIKNFMNNNFNLFLKTNIIFQKFISKKHEK